MRFRLRTLMIVLALGPPVLAALCAARYFLSSIVPAILDLVFLAGITAIGAMFAVVVSVAVGSFFVKRSR